jgi:hypothetical protein
MKCIKLSGLLILVFILQAMDSKAQKNTTTGSVLRSKTCMNYLKAPLVIWNGIEVNGFFFNPYDSDSTSVVKILKGQEAVNVYGERARSGVIVYKTKMKAGQMGPLQRVSDQQENRTSGLIIR